jgi:large subunit ribosomal protein L29
MAILRAKEIRVMSEEDILDKLRELRGELARARATVGAGGTLENTARIRELRRTIARLLTIIGEKRRGGG